jgi:nucleoside-diphosphate-sugar epimerase
LLSLVTGGAGFLGSHLVDALIAAGDQVIILDNLCTGSLSNVDRALGSGRATFVYLDIAQPVADIREPVLKAARRKKIQRIFHLASPAGYSASGAHRFPRRSGLETTSVVDLAAEQNARLVYAAASEPADDTLDHALPSLHVQPEACSDAVLSATAGEQGPNVGIVRFFGCYGPRMHNAWGRFIPDLMLAASEGAALPIYGTGEQTISLTYVDDAVKLLVLFAERIPNRSQLIDIGDDREWSSVEIALTLARILGIEFCPKYVAERPGSIRNRKPDLTGAQDLGWVPQVSLEKGLQLTYEWFARESRLFV